MLLEARRIGKHFGATEALRDVDFSVEAGEVHALMGENGAGKSTLAKILAGVLTPDSGEIRIDGMLGIGIIFQELDLFRNLSIAENMAIGNAAAGEGFFIRRGNLHRWCSGYLAQVGLDASPATPLHRLSIGQIQLVAIARALSMNARLLLMDEPTSSLTEDSVEALFGLIARLRSEDVSIVYVSHKLAEVLRIADRITVLRDGGHVATVAAAGVQPDELIGMMVGRGFTRRERSMRHLDKRVVLEARRVRSEFLSGIDFQLRAGEVLGIAGLVGSGRSELGGVLFGLRSKLAGEMLLSGKPFDPRSPSDALRAGFCLTPEDRRWEGLFPQMSVLENTTMGILPVMSTHGFLQRAKEVEAVGRFALKLALAAPTDAPILSLSGGNQQKVLMSRWLLTDPQVLFLDEPTRGIDVGAKEQIYEIIDELASRGKGILLVSSEMPELFRCSDRIMVLHEGRQMGILDSAKTTQEEIMTLAAGHVRGYCPPEV